MATRAQDPRIQSLYDSGTRVYSFSRLGTINDCLYSTYLTYIQHQRGLDSIYSSLGSVLHDSLQEIIEDSATEECLLPNFKQGLEEAESIGLRFPKDFRGEDSIRSRYVKNIENFCQTFYKPSGKFEAEKLLILDLPNNRAVIGYSDLIQHFPDGSVRVLDWKSSTRYRPQELLEHGRQLVIYQMALEQAGYTVRPGGWVFLKYVKVDYVGKKTKKSKEEVSITKICERSKLFDEIGLAVANKLEQLGYDEIDQEILLHEFQKTNSLAGMPKKIQDEFSIKPYVQYYPVTDELRQECLDYIHKTADVFESRNPKLLSDWPAKAINSQNAFFCRQLCGFRNSCSALEDYNKMIECKLKSKDEMEDLF